jgi:hypothetical protein
MSKIKAILAVYGMDAINKNLSSNTKDEEFFGWVIVDMTQEELVSKFTKREIIQIYYKAV